MNKKAKPIDVSKIDLEKMKDKTVDLPGLLEYAHTIGGFSITPTKEGMIKKEALEAMSEQTQMQLDQVFEQMQLLAKQVKAIKERAEVSQIIYGAKISFKPLVNHEYYLYQDNNNDYILSMVSPKEWGEKLPFKSFIHHVKLLADHTWKIINS